MGRLQVLYEKRLEEITTVSRELADIEVGDKVVGIIRDFRIRKVCCLEDILGEERMQIHKEYEDINEPPEFEKTNALLKRLNDLDILLEMAETESDAYLVENFPDSARVDLVICNGWKVIDTQGREEDSDMRETPILKMSEIAGIKKVEGVFQPQDIPGAEELLRVMKTHSPN